MRLVINCVIISLLLQSACKSKKAFNEALVKEVHTKEAMQQDYKIMRSALEEAHPGLYWYISKEKLDYKLDSTYNSIDKPMKSYELYRKIAPIVSEIKCGHTRLFYPALKYDKKQKEALLKKGRAPLSQFNYYIENNRIFVSNVKKKTDNGVLQGMEILSIDSLEISYVLNEAKRFYSSDGYNKTFYKRVSEIGFSSLYNIIAPRKDSVLLTLKSDGNICKTWVKYYRDPLNKKDSLLSKEEKEKIKEYAKNKLAIKKKNRYKGFNEDGKPLLSLKIDSIIPKTAILKVESFYFTNNNHKRFFKESFETIKTEKIENLILDLRDNGGGSLTSCNLLFRYLYNQPAKFSSRADMNKRYFKAAKYFNNGFLSGDKGIFPLVRVKKDDKGYAARLFTEKVKDPMENVFDGKLIVLINGYSFSASSLLAANLQGVKRGTFVGEETGGGYNQCAAGSIPFITLPNSKLKLRLPLKKMSPNTNRELVGRGVMPDIEITENLNDLLLSKDVQLEKAKSIIYANTVANK